MRDSRLPAANAALCSSDMGMSGGPPSLLGSLMMPHIPFTGTGVGLDVPAIDTGMIGPQ